ncbi:hypothetical protein P261_00254 [Lachnospiraceae bacterium TWA4]|nr:hypothetical protein P261_00254 [Lachnospiraceae bacterium TWA4]
MRVFLMNKNKKVLLADYIKEYHSFTKIYEIYSIDYAPLVLFNATHDKSKSLLKTLNNWFKGRGIPSWRKDLERLLENLQISSAEELLDQAFGLSLSDQYWIKEENDRLTWEDINFFQNDFKYQGYLNASLSLSNNCEEISLHSPNNTTDGMIQKAWIIENGQRLLVKGTYTPSRQEPINEWLATNLCKRLGFCHCPYTIRIMEKQMVSVCENFIGEDEELIMACDILSFKKQDNNKSDYEHYMNILEEHEVPNAREEVENMIIIDYLLMNTDRHMKNFGIIRDVNTLKWKKVAPIFDSGQGMQCEQLTMDMNFTDGTGKFFHNTKKKFSTYLGLIKDISRIDIKNLDGLIEEYQKILYEYQLYTEISDIRIERQVLGLKKRIQNLEKSICKGL